MEQKELQHHGVLGMKWGQHKAQQIGESYTYKSHATKKYTHKAKAAKTSGKNDKAEKFDKMAKRSAEMDKKMQSITKNTSTGKTVAAALLTGGASLALQKVYQQHRAMGASKTKAMMLSFIGGITLSHIMKAHYIRQ